MKTLVLFSRENCHLCDRLRAALAPVIADRATLEIVDIDSDPQLVERYGLRIPVLVGGGQELSGFPLNAAALEGYLARGDG